MNQYEARKKMIELMGKILNILMAQSHGSAGVKELWAAQTLYEELRKAFLDGGESDGRFTGIQREEKSAKAN